MNFDNSFDALLKPGEATVYFDVHAKTRFEVDATSYSGINAWWLAELSRLIYRQGADEISNAKPPTRKEILAGVGLREIEFFNEKGTQAALIKPSADDRFAVLIFRGTNDLMDWLTNVDAIPESWAGRGRVHQGFKEAFERMWETIVASLDKNVPANCPLFVTGHSLGAALAALAASLKRPRALYTFGSPRVGDEDFAASLSGVSVFRVVDNRDIVTTVPPAPFHHVGELHYITHNGSMLINPSDDAVALDRLKRDGLLSRDLQKLFSDAPEPLADHAPVNYVAHLERQV